MVVAMSFAATPPTARIQQLRMRVGDAPAETVAARLRALELESGDAGLSGAAAMTRGQLHFARGEFRTAADVFSRLAARVGPDAKPEARYWAGLSWLGAGQLSQARATLEEVARVPGPRQNDAVLAVAHTFEPASTPERIAASLEGAVRSRPDENAPGLLERLATVLESRSQNDAARGVRERLLREYPRSIEAAPVRAALFEAQGAAPDGAWTVTIGSFIDPGRARGLASSAKRAGFPQARVITRGRGLAAAHLVVLGQYRRRVEAERAGDQATRALGVSFQVVRGL